MSTHGDHRHGDNHSHSDDYEYVEDVHHGDPGAELAQFTKRNHRRQIGVATTAAVLVLAGGAFMITAHEVNNDDNTVTQDANAIAPHVVTPTQPQVAAAPSEQARAAQADDLATPAQSRTSTPGHPNIPTRPAPTSADVRRQIKAARSAAAADGHPLQRPLTVAGEAQTPPGLSERTETTRDGTIRVVSAKGDLTDQREMLLAADSGQPVGHSHCTNNLRFSAGAPPRKLAGLLLCWRISGARSVLTLATAKGGHKPSADASTAIIDQEWAKLR